LNLFDLQASFLFFPSQFPKTIFIMLSNTITTMALLAATATAGVVPAIKYDALTKRSETTWDPKGNIKLTCKQFSAPLPSTILIICLVSRETVQVGSLTTDEIMAAVIPICHESGQCETNSIELTSYLTRNRGVDEIKVTLGPDGEYPTWIRNGLVDLLALAVKQVAKCEQVSYMPICHGAPGKVDCDYDMRTGTNCEVPQFWGINYQAPDAVNAAPPNVGLNIAMEKVDNKDLCEGVFGGLGAVAGAVNGYAGGVFTLLAFACV
jgi:hypothetical protein